MKLLMTIFAFLYFLKNLLFWFWLWQLKEYHFGRFKAHFESQKFRKFFSSFWRFKKPKFTLKMKVIFATSFLLSLFLFSFSVLFKDFFLYLFLLILILFSPFFATLLIFLFQIPVFFWQKLLLKKASQKIEKFKDLIVIGITGSFGKTSTKEFLAKILEKKYKVLKTKKHINAEVGIAQTILRDLNSSHQIFIAEIGAYERGKITQVCKMLKPQIGILTGLNEQHLATFGSMENIIEGEGFELIKNLPQEGMAVMNWDNKYIKLKVKNQKFKVKNQKFYSIKEKKDIWAEEIRVEKEKIFFKAFTKKGDFAFFKVNLIGAHNVSNLLAAALVACEKFEFSLSEISQICQKFDQKMGAMVLKKGRGGVNIIDSTYSANPDGVICALDYLKVWRDSKKIIVMPCLIELGRASKKVHQRIGRKIAKICDLAIVTTKDRFKEIKQGAIAQGMKKENILFIEKPKEIIEKIKKSSKEGDIILFEGRILPEIIKNIEIHY